MRQVPCMPNYTWKLCYIILKKYVALSVYYIILKKYVALSTVAAQVLHNYI